MTASTVPRLRGALHAGALVALVPAAIVLFAATDTGRERVGVGFFIFGLAAMFGVSAMYHRGHWSPGPKALLQRLDHSTIFLAISGTYLAIAGLSMHGTIRVALMIVIGAGAGVGITVRQLAIDAPKWANTLPYLVVSWAAAAVMPQIYRGGGPLCFSLIIAGGAAYTIGAVFYGTKRPRLSPRVFGYHELFHACTLIGAGLHFAAIAVALR